MATVGVKGLNLKSWLSLCSLEHNFHDFESCTGRRLSVVPHLLRLSYFCSESGALRYFPNVTRSTSTNLDCLGRHWYRQAATSPKNVVLLL